MKTTTKRKRRNLGFNSTSVFQHIQMKRFLREIEREDQLESSILETMFVLLPVRNGR